MKRFLVLLLSHGAALAAGFALGVYALPILTAPPGPGSEALGAVMQKASYTARFRRDLEGSDLLHWGEGTVYVSDGAVAFAGTLAPGPDYRLYLAPAFVQTEEDFLALKDDAVQVAQIAGFGNFLVDLPPSIDPDDFTTVVVWCESFGQFITAAEYRPPAGD